MSDLFDKNLIQGVISSLLVLFISFLLGSRAKTPVPHDKTWKVVKIIAWLMIIGSAYMFLINISSGGFDNNYVGLSIPIFFLGIILELVARFFIWWHR
ncbi:MAG: hypothetical protein WCV69_02195 [Patescibacteria group bacterium]|jgi:hypothetical protein